LLEAQSYDNMWQLSLFDPLMTVAPLGSITRISKFWPVVISREAA